jgi:hypothetical protein
METAVGLLIELALAGIVMLGSVALPFLTAHREKAFDLTGEDGRVTLILALGFLLGVVVDRCGDTIIERWEGALRCQFAWEPRTLRERHAHVAAVVTDPFPEDWLRIKALSSEREGVMRWYEQLRVRIRVARTIVMHTPALVTSVFFAWRVHQIMSPPPPDQSSVFIWCLLPGLHLVFALIALRIARSKKPPRSSDFAARAPSSEEAKAFYWDSAVTTWFALEGFLAFLTACCIVSQSFLNAGHTGAAATLTGNGSLPLALAVLALGACMEAVAIEAWMRLNHTFLTFIWHNALFNEPEQLKGACLRAINWQPDSQARLPHQDEEHRATSRAG